MSHQGSKQRMSNDSGVGSYIGRTGTAGNTTRATSHIGLNAGRLTAPSEISSHPRKK